MVCRAGGGRRSGILFSGAAQRCMQVWGSATAFTVEAVATRGMRLSVVQIAAVGKICQPRSHHMPSLMPVQISIPPLR
ncbi:hypothetical protein A4R35_01125 [Thermogemmatispora tikiterensis]|uniref:Uncharacterized protein n=1 Tax=Thermogemmatispora tikiterensis TaxID=1825093 RepID=A0A328VFL4_9CHLR|nr:hypothetical protein A4R35_01125 [Thermogemmatispora tikiterensis]